MEIDDPEFLQAVADLRELAIKGAALPALLELVKARVGKGSFVLAAVIFCRAFDLPLRDATSLCGWRGFAVERGYRGTPIEVLEAEYGEVIRERVRRLKARDESA